MTVDRHHHEYRIAKIICHEIAHQWLMITKLLSMRSTFRTEHEYFTVFSRIVNMLNGFSTHLKMKSDN